MTETQRNGHEVKLKRNGSQTSGRTGGQQGGEIARQNHTQGMERDKVCMEKENDGKREKQIKRWKTPHLTLL